MTFVGESLPITDAFGVDWAAVAFRGYGTGTPTSTPWVLWCYESPELLTVGDAAVVSWVVEVAAGTGVLILEETDHTDVDDGSTATWTTLGSHAVTGGTQLVVTSTLQDVASLLSFATIPGLRLSAASGTAQVQQVKLRVWPPGGALGGWSPDPFTPPVYTANPQFQVIPGGAGTTYLSSQGAFRSDLASRVSGALISTGDDVITAGEMLAIDDPLAVSLTVAGTIGAVVLTRDTTGSTIPDGEFGVDWTYPPDEVPWDDLDVILPPVPDTAIPAYWVQPVASLETEPNAFTGSPPAAYPADGNFYIGAVELSTLPTAGDPVLPWVGGTLGSVTLPPGPLTVGASAHAEVTLPEFDDVLRVAVWHDGHLGDIDVIGGSSAYVYRGRITDDFPTEPLEHLLYGFRRASIRYWSPTAPALVPPLRLMQRGDGLGMGSGRVLGAGTRQGSIRVFGSL